jgi:hypothetical protein
VFVFVFQEFPYFLTPQDAPGSSYVFFAPVLELSISPGTLGVLLDNNIETKIWVLLLLCILDFESIKILEVKKKKFCC